MNHTNAAQKINFRRHSLQHGYKTTCIFHKRNGYQLLSVPPKHLAFHLNYLIAFSQQLCKEDTI